MGGGGFVNGLRIKFPALAFQRLRDAIPEPAGIERMDQALVEEPMSTDVIPMHVCGENHDRQIYECPHELAYVADASPGIYKGRAFAADEEVAVDSLPLPVFGDCKSRLVERLNTEPVECRGALHSQKACVAFPPKSDRPARATANCQADRLP